eukprot:TRINITY_DN5269_c0_g1::TRINITY_DN5269_c0_g1_i1::g.23426::m.23426 TRINITY_DN5269_c0_g1::TRINITY_DN5269_c0_g1_i1::g.23426  ORF type:complete len:483 (+),score=78.86,sp/Q9WUC8/PLRG1_RAT/52.08/3e-176,WD40/PF00400.27/4.6e-10,WD40/PF00400.27/1.1e-07,WD40/PF00400.27/1.2e-08,WD40/PF00400.27/1e-07,WD40/PF00400.27/0.0016,WD40/PF00400.27/2.5e-05,WD40/PF00400.27/0.054,Nucleoporin_N/PF08801.6/18,Nucleoporin_N/PF08801.6/0.49,Nucleoporin_N/PF08801.6/8.6,Nup160/PF11715.3/47,Nup160/PF11715.3/0.35,Nup160/PF11715.3
MATEFAVVKDLPAPQPAQKPQTTQPAAVPAIPGVKTGSTSVEEPKVSNQLALTMPGHDAFKRATAIADNKNIPSITLMRKQQEQKIVKPDWHAPWKLMRVIAGHQGWVRSVDVDVSNQWFATGAADRTIKIWDLASGELKVTLTGHIGIVRGLAISNRHPYLFSCGDDKQVKCWDLEQNKVIRQYHGHLSGVYSCAVHPTLDVLVTAGRDSTARVWDIRTKSQIMVLSGHQNTVATVKCQGADPQVVTGSMDNTIRLWDLAAGKTLATLTNHKKSIRDIVLHPTQFSFVSGSADNLKKWSFPKGEFVQNFTGHNAIINALAVNEQNVLVSGGDNGSLHFWDYKTGYNFQQEATIAQPGSLESEAGIFSMTFDKTGSRLITTEADKSIKIWKEDPDATPETHPIKWKPQREKRY